MRSKLARYMTNLEHFATVVEVGGISAASSLLGLTQPALSRSIMRLEEVLGMKVLERSPRGIVPTEGGRALVEHVSMAIAELNKVMAISEVHRGQNDGFITCGAGSLSMNHILPQAISASKRKLGKLQINLVEGRTPELLHQLKSGELDLVLGIEQDATLYPDLQGERLLTETFQFCVRASHPLAQKPKLGLRDIATADRLVMPVLKSSPVERALNAQLSRKGIELNDHRVETFSHAVMRHLVYKDDYIAFCSSVWFADDIKSDSLQVLNGDWENPTFGTLLYRRTDDAMTPWLSYFINEIRTAAGEIKAM
jgi:DNA-binding transcriptional LysR family regulator